MGLNNRSTHEESGIVSLLGKWLGGKMSRNFMSMIEEIRTKLERHKNRESIREMNISHEIVRAGGKVVMPTGMQTGVLSMFST